MYRPKLLIAFDFDHTLVDDNSDTYIIKRLAPNGKLPDEIKAIYRKKCWTTYMGAIFK